jgi:ribosomal protein S1
MDDVAGWNQIKETLPIGTLVSCAVIQHAPFGVFVSIPAVPFDGLIQITDFKDEGRMTPAEFPAIGTSLKAVVLGFKETGRQIWLGVKPSQFAAGAAAAHRLPSVTDARFQALMDRNTEGCLTVAECEELELLVEVSETMSLLRARALHLFGRKPQ